MGLKEAGLGVVGFDLLGGGVGIEDSELAVEGFELELVEEGKDLVGVVFVGSTGVEVKSDRHVSNDGGQFFGLEGGVTSFCQLGVSAAGDFI